MHRSVFLILVFLTLAITIHGQSTSQREMISNVDAGLFKGLRYRLVGPSRGGRVTTVTGVPSQPKTFYMGVASGGLFRTTDSGATWTPITDGKVPLGSTGCVAVADSDPNMIYLGTVRMVCAAMSQPVAACTSRPTAARPGSSSGLYNAGQIGAVRIHPTNPDIVWVAAKATSSSRTTSAVFSRPPTAARRGTKCCLFPTTSARWMSNCNRAIRTSSTRGCRDSSASRGRSSAARATAASTRAPTAASTSRRSPMAADRIDRQGKPRGHRRKPESHLRADRSKARRRLLSLGRRRQTWALINSQGALMQRPFYYTTLGADPTNADSCTRAPKASSNPPTAVKRSRRFARRTATTTTSGSTRKTARS